MKRFFSMFTGVVAGIVFVVTCETPGGMGKGDGGFGAGQDALAAPATQTLTADTDINQLQTGSVTVPPMSVSAAVLTGPFVITDLSGGTDNTCFNIAITPSWKMMFAVTAGNAVHGARLVVKSGETLTISNPATVPCSCVYSGYRPY